MNFVWLFKSSKDFQLDKSTFVNLRWIALLGQLVTISIVKIIFQFDFHFLLCNFIVGIGIFTNFNMLIALAIAFYLASIRV